MDKDMAATKTMLIIGHRTQNCRGHPLQLGKSSRSGYISEPALLLLPARCAEIPFLPPSRRSIPAGATGRGSRFRSRYLRFQILAEIIAAGRE
jgi:hypothetical protein